MSRLPKGVRWKHSAYYLVKKRRRTDADGRMRWPETWIRLGSDADEMRLALADLKGRRVNWSEAVTVAAFVRDRWLPEYVATERSPQNQKLARQRFTELVAPIIGKKLLTMVTPADLRLVRVSLEDRGLAPQTVAHVLSDLRCMFGYAVNEAGVLEASPWRKGLMPQVQARPPKALSDIEVARVLEACPEQHRPMFRFALLTGMRYGELRFLRWEHVDRSESPPVVTVQASHGGPTKSRRARMVPLVPEAVAVLDGLERGAPFVFPTRAGGLRGRNMGWLNARIAETVAGFHFHRLRHTCSRNLEQGGVPAAVAGRLLGQSARVNAQYAAPHLDDIRRAVVRGNSVSDVRDSEGDTAEQQKRGA